MDTVGPPGVLTYFIFRTVSLSQHVPLQSLVRRQNSENGRKLPNGGLP